MAKTKSGPAINKSGGVGGAKGKKMPSPTTGAGGNLKKGISKGKKK